VVSLPVEPAYILLYIGNEPSNLNSAWRDDIISLSSSNDPVPANFRCEGGCLNLITILGIALGLAMDAFAVSIAVGSRLTRLEPRPVFRLSFHFGLFQFMMPIIGWFVGNQIARYIQHYDHWLAFLLLTYIGAKMIWESWKHDGSQKSITDPTRKWSLIILSIATSIDALAVGLSMALLKVDILVPSVIIGIVAAAMTLIGMVFGRQLGARFGKKMEFVGGLILIAIGIRIVIGHMG
jgi:manganese efflux pump family protein